MINKQSLWFLTLFSLVLVLGVYYITMPSSTLATLKEVNLGNIKTDVVESDILASLRVERDEKTLSTMEELQSVINMEDATAEEKNNAVEELKILNLEKGKEASLEEIVEKEYNIKSVVDIDKENVIVTVNSSEHDVVLANGIMRSIQKEFDVDKNITVKFQ